MARRGEREGGLSRLGTPRHPRWLDLVSRCVRGRVARCAGGNRSFGRLRCACPRWLRRHDCEVQEGGGVKTVCMNPLPTGPDQGDGGVRRVVDALVRYLPEFGWSVTADPQGADLIANHGAFDVTVPGKPMVSHCHGLYWREYDWPSWGDRVNGQVISSMLKANAVTAPSEWV